MIVWIEKRLLLAVHERQLAEHGGLSGVRDETLLESALARPQQLHAYGEPAPDLADLAAALAHGIVRNHPFLDGNKPTAWVACRTFLIVNGVDVIADAAEKYTAMLALAEGRLEVDAFAAWLRQHISSAAPGKVQEPRSGYSAAPSRRRSSAGNR